MYLVSLRSEQMRLQDSDTTWNIPPPCLLRRFRRGSNTPTPPSCSPEYMPAQPSPYNLTAPPASGCALLGYMIYNPPLHSPALTIPTFYIWDKFREPPSPPPRLSEDLKIEKPERRNVTELKTLVFCRSMLYSRVEKKVPQNHRWWTYPIIHL